MLRLADSKCYNRFIVHVYFSETQLTRTLFGEYESHLTAHGRMVSVQQYTTHGQYRSLCIDGYSIWSAQNGPCLHCNGPVVIPCPLPLQIESNRLVLVDPYASFCTWSCAAAYNHQWRRETGRASRGELISLLAHRTGPKFRGAGYKPTVRAPPDYTLTQLGGPVHMDRSYYGGMGITIPDSADMLHHPYVMVDGEIRLGFVVRQLHRSALRDVTDSVGSVQNTQPDPVQAAKRAYRDKKRASSAKRPVVSKDMHKLVRKHSKGHTDPPPATTQVPVAQTIPRSLAQLGFSVCKSKK